MKIFLFLAVIGLLHAFWMSDVCGAETGFFLKEDGKYLVLASLAERKPGRPSTYGKTPDNQDVLIEFPPYDVYKVYLHEYQSKDIDLGSIQVPRTAERFKWQLVGFKSLKSNVKVLVYLNYGAMCIRFVNQTVGSSFSQDEIFYRESDVRGIPLKYDIEMFEGDNIGHLNIKLIAVHGVGPDDRKEVVLTTEIVVPVNIGAKTEPESGRGKTVITEEEKKRVPLEWHLVKP